MAIQLSDFEEQIERRLPIIVLVDESGSGSEMTQMESEAETFHSGDYCGCLNLVRRSFTITSQVYMSVILKELYAELCRCNVRGTLAVISYGDKISFRYPVLTEGEALYYRPIEDINCGELCDAVLSMEQSKTAVLGTALKLAKAIIDDVDTTGEASYEPVVIILSAGQPSAGWENAYDQLIHQGRSSCCHVYCVNMGTEVQSLNGTQECMEFLNCPLNEGLFGTMKAKDKGTNKNFCGMENYGEYIHKFVEKVGTDTLGISSEKERTAFYQDLEKIIKESTKRIDEQKNSHVAVLGEEFGIAEEMRLRKQQAQKKESNDSLCIEEGKTTNESKVQKKNFMYTHMADAFIFDGRLKDKRFRGVEVVRELVSKFTFKPMEMVEERVQIEKPRVNIPSSQVTHGDNPNANSEENEYI